MVRSLREQTVRDMILSIISARLSIEVNEAESIYGEILDKIPLTILVKKAKGLATVETKEQCLAVLKE